MSSVVPSILTSPGLQSRDLHMAHNMDMGTNAELGTLWKWTVARTNTLRNLFPRR